MTMTLVAIIIMKIIMIIVKKTSTMMQTHVSVECGLYFYALNYV